MQSAVRPLLYGFRSPNSGDRDILTRDDYVSIMVQARALGCRKMQFIGGEPQLNGDFQDLLVKAKTLGFEFIEVFSNLTRLADETVQYAADNGICFATSVYSNEASGHDAITRVKSSHTRTMTNLKKLIGAGIETRAAIIVMDRNKDTVSQTKDFLLRLGVGHVSSGEIREFGRGEQILAQKARLSGLCGHCWSGKLCITPVWRGISLRDGPPMGVRQRAGDPARGDRGRQPARGNARRDLRDSLAAEGGGGRRRDGSRETQGRREFKAARAGKASRRTHACRGMPAKLHSGCLVVRASQLPAKL